MKYPYIGKNVNKIGDFSIAVITRESFGVLLENNIDHKPLYEFMDHFNEECFINITAEYLANTYGEVKSKEHAEFIVKLAEVNGFTIEFISNFEAKSFIIKDKCLSVFNIHINGLDKENLNKITIPLPPECEEKIYRYEGMGNKPKHFDCICNKCGGRCCIGNCDEFPKVGSTVEAKHDSGQVLKGELLAITNEYAIIQQVGHEQHLHLSAWKFSKPKTPEQELREFLHLLWRENNEDFDDFADIAVLHLTKKGEGDE